MNKSKIPVIYIHFGNTDYLKHSLDFALQNNPDKDIYLLGDSLNEFYKKHGINHQFFSKYDDYEEIVLFNNIFKYIRGGVIYSDFKGEMVRIREFERFCFVRWFYLYYFMAENHIEKCWYFDSDTLILTSLTNQEPKYMDYDFTEQCNGSCMKGLISINNLKDYINEINRLFLDDKYLNWIKNELTGHPGWVFCDMRAYDAYKQKFRPNSKTLYSVVNNEVFDDALLQERNSEMEFNRLLKVRMKKLFYINKNIYIKNTLTEELVKLNCINLSWLPTFYVENLVHKLKHGKDITVIKKIIPITIYLIKKELRNLINRTRDLSNKFVKIQ